MSEKTVAKVGAKQGNKTTTTRPSPASSQRSDVVEASSGWSIWSLRTVAFILIGVIICASLMFSAQSAKSMEELYKSLQDGVEYAISSGSSLSASAGSPVPVKKQSGEVGQHVDIVAQTREKVKTQEDSASIAANQSSLLDSKLEDKTTAAVAPSEDVSTITGADSVDPSDSHLGDAEKPKKKGLNVIVLYPDDMRHDSLGCAGTQKVKTPFLDQMASEGIRFTHNCVTTSICWISRATLFSGQYVSRHNSTHLYKPIGESAWNHSYPAILKRNGYYVGHIGKWQYYNVPFVKEFFDDARVYEGRHIFKVKQKELHVTDRNRDDAIDFLRTRPKDRNFALQVAFYAPKAVGTGDMQWTPMEKSEHIYDDEHFDYPSGMNESYHRLPRFFHETKTEARNRFRQRFGTPEKYDASMKAYFRMISEIDEACRDIYNELEAQGILNETMIIFTTDNGFFHAEHGLSGKWYAYQESIRVPLIIRDPRMPREKVGKTNDDFTLNIDLASTILGAAGLSPDPGMQGRDIADLYLRKTDPPWRTEFYYEFPSKGKKKIPGSYALVRKDFKYFYYPEWNVEQLFNLKEDPLEENDIFDEPQHADLIKEMRQRFKELQQQAK